MRNHNKPKRLETAAAAEYLQLAPSTLVTWRCTRRYPLPFMKLGSRVFYDIEDLDKFIESRKVRPISL